MKMFIAVNGHFHVEIQSNMQIVFVIFMSTVKNLQHVSTLVSPDKKFSMSLRKHAYAIYCDISQL